MDNSETLNILQVSTYDIAGGAERIAWSLFDAYRQRGHRSWLAVGQRRGTDPDVLQIPLNLNPWTRMLLALIARYPGDERGKAWVPRIARILSQPGRYFRERYGIENQSFPESRRIPDLPPHRPDIVHCHNLHGDYFDLRALPAISRRLPLVVTLHDAWMLSGHCAHSFECTRWKTGCGSCPDLTIYPAISRDATAFNWRFKRRIYRRSRLHIATPSQWLMDKVRESMLAPHAADMRVIPNGTDLRVFRPGDRTAARRQIGIDASARVLLFTANGIRSNPWKDYTMLRAAVNEVAVSMPETPVVFLALGEGGPPERIGCAEIRFVPYESEPAAVARFYQAADLYVHAARADTFPNTVIESLACGTPVVATAIGGIPEQVKGLAGVVTEEGTPRNVFTADQATGILVKGGDSGAMARSIRTLLDEHGVRSQLAANAARDAAARFDLNVQVDRYLEWYREILKSAKGHEKEFSR